MDASHFSSIRIMRLAVVVACAACVAASPLERRQSASTQSPSTSATTPSPTSAAAASKSSYSAPRPSAFTQPLAFTAPPLFPSNYYTTAFYSGYEATQTSVEPQPMIYDTEASTFFALNLTVPTGIPTVNKVDPIVLPPSDYTSGPLNYSAYQALTSNAQTQAMLNATLANITSIINGTGYGNSSCQKCLASFQTAQQLASQAPQEVPLLLNQLCTSYKGSNCRNFLADSDGAVATNIIRYANFTGNATDGRYLCAQFSWIPTLTCPKARSNRLAADLRSLM